ncbi:MAG: cysteine rich repeat-containing protein [Rhodomicrobium sp.]
MFKFASVIFGAGLVFGGVPALAGDLPPDTADNVMNACRAEYHRVCSYVVPGEGRVARCLMDHEVELAAPCLKTLKLAFAIEACMPDYRRLCQGVPSGPQSFECLANRMQALNPECRRVVTANAPYFERRSEPYGYNRRPVPYGDTYAGRARVPSDDANPYRGPVPYGDTYAGRGRVPSDDGYGYRGPTPYGDSYAFRDPKSYGQAEGYGRGQPGDERYGNPDDQREGDPYGAEGEGGYAPYGDRFGGQSYAGPRYPYGFPYGRE